MKALFITLLMIGIIFPSSLAFGQTIKPSSSLTVEILPPYSYKSDSGSTVVLGEVQNKNNFSVTGIKLAVSFYDQTGKVVEFKTGTTSMKVIPAGGKAPYSIESTANPVITDISINLTGFNSSPGRPQLLSISPGSLEISDQLIISGTIHNDGTVLTNGTVINLISYDSFGRVVGISSAQAQPEDIGVSKTSTFTITSNPNSITKSYKLIAESDNYQSPMVDVTDVKTSLKSSTDLVSITNVSVTDLLGTNFSSIPVGSPTKITSEIWLKYAPETSEQPFVVYIQIKQVGSQSASQNKDQPAVVEFIGSAQGTFHGIEKQKISMDWIPERSGTYYIEAYLWDPNGVALAEPSSHINVILVK